MESQLPQGNAGFAVGDVVETGLPDQPQTQQQIASGDPPSETTDTTIPDTTVQNAAASPSDSGEGVKPQAPSSAAAAAKASRKRTKTGCLTCRKRRIKCGEERPTCANCIKSKRVCEGYTQRVVFKAGINGTNGMYRPAIVPASRMVHPYPIQPAPIAPAPAVGYPLQQQPRGFYEERGEQGIFQGHGPSPIAPLPSGLEQSQYQPHQDLYGEHRQGPVNQLDRSGQPAHYYPQAPDSSVFGASVEGYGGGPAPASFAPPHLSALGNSSSPPFNSPIDTRYSVASGEQMAQPGSEFGKTFKSNDTPSSSSSGPSGPPPRPAIPTAPGPGLSGVHFVGPESIWIRQARDIEREYDDDGEEGEGGDGGDDDDDDDSDEDYEVRDWDEMMVDPRTGEEMISPRAHISNVIGPHSKDFENSRISFRSCLPDQDVLTTYHPTTTSSPLMNHTTAKIFCHFIYVLGPSLSLFERYPPNPHIAFTPGAGPNGPQNVWSYTIPMLSLSHPPLLHAVLALSSLHISKLTRGPMHPSLLHYHIALRRLGKAIASPKHRSHVATLAATLLLGYYETMAAEHDKWSSHVHGAKQLLKEIDFDRLNRRAEMMEEERLTGESSYQPAAPPSLLRLRKMRRQPAVSEVDENLTAYMMGKTKRKPNLALRRTAATQFSRKEIETMQLQEDMFWWFAKMDCYQSVLSGCPLVLDYVYWSQCPPRARIGTLGTTFGSSDHFYLLLGRLCDFQVRDLKRKKAMQKANGGIWIPPPEMGGPPRGRGMGRGRGGPPPPQGAGGPPSMQGPPIGPGPPTGGPPPFPGTPYGAPPWGAQGPYGRGGPASMGPPPGGPPFEQMQFGMIPDPGPPRLPSAFANLLTSPPEPQPQEQESEPQTYESLEAATTLAESEWEEIKEAFTVFQESLGHEYQPLPIEYMTVENTPFGAAIYYRTYSIATLQSLYNMALIILHRCHPSMPAISMMAAGVAASKTAGYAVDIARITAGLVPTDRNGQINPALGASLIESSMPIFFAAVQYQDQAQRNWVVMKLREIARLTGWATASRVLLGCQRAWEKAAEMGRGPRYTRPPFEEEGELFYEAFNQQMAADTDANAGVSPGDTDAPPGSKRFLLRAAGRRTAGAIGILGEDGEDLGIRGLNLSI